MTTARKTRCRAVRREGTPPFTGITRVQGTGKRRIASTRGMSTIAVLALTAVTLTSDTAEYVGRVFREMALTAAYTIPAAPEPAPMEEISELPDGIYFTRKNIPFITANALATAAPGLQYKQNGRNMDVYFPIHDATDLRELGLDSIMQRDGEQRAIPIEFLLDDVTADWNWRLAKPIDLNAPWAEYLHDALSNRGLEGYELVSRFNLMLGLKKIESSEDHGATSPTGAKGLMQLTDETGQAIAARLKIPYRPYNPRVNIVMSEVHVDDILRQFERATGHPWQFTPWRVVKAYNWGMGAELRGDVHRWPERHKEAINHVRKFYRETT